MTQQGTTSPGWYPDPWFTGQRRWFNGTDWTADTFADGSAPVTPRGSYGPAPTQHAATPPPPPEWGSTTPLPPPPAASAAWPEAEPVAAPARRGVSAWAVAAIVGAVLLALLAVWILRPHSPSSTAAPTPRPTSAAPAPSPSTAPTRPSPAPSPSGSTAPSPSPSTSPGGRQKVLLENLVVRQRDVPETYFVAPIPGGQNVTGEVTLDLCGTDYPSEALRARRLQVAAVELTDPTRTTLSTEAVEYKSADATAQAFAEVEKSAAECPTGPHADSDGQQVTTKITSGIDKSWKRTEGVDRLAYQVTTTDAQGQSRTTDVVYLKRGPLFIGLYFPQPEGAQMPVEGQDTIPGIVEVFEKRLLDPPTDTPDPLPSAGGGGSGGGVQA